jgi:sugar O-acyltransferase (sialic acid O-acetyltransferase NeuD family)
MSDGRKLDLIVVGAGGFGREILGWLWDCFSPDDYQVKGFVDDNPTPVVHAGENFPVLGSPNEYVPGEKDRFLLAIGNVPARRNVVEGLLANNAQFLTMIHPTAVIAPTATIGTGCVLYPYSLLANNATLNDFVFLCNYASVGHDAHVGQYCNICPYATLNGAARLEDEVFLGSHVTIGPEATVGQGSKVSANTAVVKNMPPRSFAFGNPPQVTPLMG